MSPRDRDEHGPKHPPLHKRARTGPVAPDEDDQDSDGAPVDEIDGETSSAIADPAERARYREQRTDEERLARLEQKHDTLANVVYELRGGIKALVRQGVRREQREVEAAELRLKLVDKAADRRAKLWPKLFAFVLALVAALGAIVTAYKAGTASQPAIPATAPEVRK